MSAVTVAVTATDPDRAAALAALAAPAGDVTVVGLDPTWTSARQAAALVDHQRTSGSDVLVLASSHQAKEVAALAAHALGAGLLVDVHAVARTADAVVGHKRELGGTWDVTCTAAGPVVVLAKPGPVDAGVVEVTLLAAPPRSTGTSRCSSACRTPPTAGRRSPTPRSSSPAAVGSRATCRPSGRSPTPWVARWARPATSSRKAGSGTRRWSARPAR
ncbi:hypothetical protein [Serinibacter arcticus]|uniref:hypothetical protein n=1 Tax=Serinibacter arcticus TaxID=1655435 RepID=UPI001F38E4BC|nr:hypothetical protein [Serinibacter arcticus]